MKKYILNQLNVGKTGQGKIAKGLVIIILSPLLGTLLFLIYQFFTGMLMSTDGAVQMFWFSCILAMAILGIAVVLVGCNDKIIEQEKKKNEINE